MQCEEFETRLNELLDERLPFERDAQLRAHSSACAGCRRLAAGYGAMFHGMAEMPPAEVDASIAWRVVAECRALRKRRRLARYSVAGLAAAAAALLVAFAVRNSPRDPELVDSSPATHDVAPHDSGNESATAVAQDAALPAAHLPTDGVTEGDLAPSPADALAGGPFDHNLALARETRQTLAGAWLLVPGLPAPAEPATDDSRWDGQVAGELKPLADSTAGALGFLLHVLPGAGRGASPPPSSTPGS